jgi:hypothetical protein
MLTSAQLAGLRGAVDRVIAQASQRLPVWLVRDCALSAWVYLGWCLSRWRHDVMVGPTSSLVPTVATFRAGQSLGDIASGGFVWEDVTASVAGAGDATSRGVLLFVTNLRNRVPLEAEWGVFVQDVRPRVVAKVTLPEGAPDRANGELAMDAWCTSVQECVLTGVDGLGYIPDRLGVVVAGPAAVAFAVGRALAHVRADYRQGLQVIAFDRSSAEGDRLPTLRWTS